MNITVICRVRPQTAHVRSIKIAVTSKTVKMCKYIETNSNSPSAMTMPKHAASGKARLTSGPE